MHYISFIPLFEIAATLKLVVHLFQVYRRTEHCRLTYIMYLATSIELDMFYEQRTISSLNSPSTTHVLSDVDKAQLALR